MTARPRAGIERADARPEHHPQIRAQTLALVLLAVMGLGAFSFLTWLMWSHGQVGFDQPLLTLARTWTAYTPSGHSCRRPRTCHSSLSASGRSSGCSGVTIGGAPCW